jgi:hypothetical protein
MVHESLVAAGLEGSDGVVVCECYVVVLYQLLLRDWKFGSVLASLEGRKEILWHLQQQQQQQKWKLPHGLQKTLQAT